MGDPGSERHASSPAEIKERLGAERAGVAFLVFRDGDGRQQIRPLAPAEPPLTIGRGAGADVRVAWDEEVSRLHAELECRGGEWMVVDDGLSANGTWVNGEQLRGRRRLGDGDAIRVGHTAIVFRAPAAGNADAATVRAAGGGDPPHVSAAQKRVLVALARPYRAGGAFATPATNQAVADEVVLTIDAVKAHLRQLFDRFGIAGLPQNAKRARLVELAFLYGIVGDRDFEA